MIDLDKNLAVEQMLDNEFLVPLDSAQERLGQLAGLFRAITLQARGFFTEADSNPRSVLLEIETLAKLGHYVSRDCADWLDATHETARDQHVPTIIAALS